MTVEAMTHLSPAPTFESVVYIALLILIGLAIIAGYRTRIASAGAAALELWLLVWPDGNALVYSLVATLGVALVLLGPGTWSVDSRLSGWRRIHIPRRQG